MSAAETLRALAAAELKSGVGVEMDNLDDVLNGEEAEIVEEPTEEATAEAGEEATEESEISEGVTDEAEEAEQESQPPSDQNNKTVPVSALESVRSEKKDWKEKAIRAQAELEAMQKYQQPQPEPQEVDPLQKMQQDLINERFNTSEMLARQAHSDIDEKFAVWQEAVQANPALTQVLQAQKHPWEFMYQEAAKIQLQQEIGSDPTAYKEKLKEEVKAELQAVEPTETNAQKPHISKSLAGSRSAATRGQSTFSGPSSLDDILN